jgi:ribonuclease J
MPEPVTITFLGGLGEIGRNCAAIGIKGRIMLLDCGLMFPDAEMLGIDLVLPDFTYLREHRDRIEGCIVTHGHEDHMGGLSYLLRDLSFPIIGSELTLALARNRIEEAGLLGRTRFVVVADNERRRFGPFDCEFIPVTHSVPNGFSTAFHTPQGTILHTGDFKLDLTPVDGRLTDLAVMGAIAQNEGIRLLLSDSTNADQRGHSRSETSVGKVLRDVFAAHRGRRIVTACFASHIHRVQQIADAAIDQGRVVATLGLSMKKNVAIARDLGALTIPENKLFDIKDVEEMDPGKVCVISTGSQGEPMSALARMAANESKWIKLSADDTVILSSHPIPGNEMNVSKVIDGLVRMGVQVVDSGIEDVHATGHAKQEELKTILSITKPEWFTPVHGEFRHLAAHAGLAQTMGVAPAHINVCEDGDVLVVGGTRGTKGK